MPRIRIAFIIVLSLSNVLLKANTLDSTVSESVVVDAISISGNKTTKAFIISRELGFEVGDTLQRKGLAIQMRMARNRVFNTHLFNDVILNFTEDNNRISVSIKVIERWYVWPAAYVKFADRNINVWLENRDLSRLNAELNVQHFNFRGRNEKLRLDFSVGYSTMAGINYSIPFIDKDRKHGLQFQALARANREVWYQARNNELQFFYDDIAKSFQEYQAQFTYTYRPGLWLKQYFSLSYKYTGISDSLLSLKLPQEYLAGGRPQQSALGISYLFKFDKRNIAFYPTKGFYFSMLMAPIFLVEEKQAYLRVETELDYLQPTSSRSFLGLGFFGKSSAGPQPYYLYRSLGYRQLVRGYEQYVIDGEHAGLVKSNWRFKLLEKTYSAPYIKSESFSKIPVSIWTGPHLDVGYVSAKSTDLSLNNNFQNSWLSGYGWAVELVTYYDKVFRLEYSMNNWGKGGLYVHFVAPI